MWRSEVKRRTVLGVNLSRAMWSTVTMAMTCPLPLISGPAMSAARCETGESLPRGMEVIVTRYDRGVAYIRPWDELAGPAETITKREQITE